MQLSTTARIMAGATLLDAFAPGWEHVLDVGTLNIEFEETCALAHLFDSYTDGHDAVFADDDPEHLVSADHGFYSYAAAAGLGLNHPDVRMEYARLTNEWADFIEQRRAAKEPMQLAA